MKRLLATLTLLLLAAPAAAILIKGGNGNTTAPPDDPGWLNAGLLGGLNGVYLGYGWVLTAAHVPAAGGIATFDGTTYPIVDETRTIISHDPSFDADLWVMKLDPYPEHLPVLEIRQTNPGLGVDVTMIGRGRDQGDPIPGGQGFFWATTLTKRWGLNEVGGSIGGTQYSLYDFDSGPGVRTETIVTEFSLSGSDDEGIATLGDSGGGLFIKNGASWELAGIQIAVNGISGEARYGDDTLSANLARYRGEILSIVRPCDDGVDNDGDTVADWPADSGCSWIGDVSEEFACSDGYDNDLDGLTDFPQDPECVSANGPIEEPDQDGDVVADDDDNCLVVPNSSQLDTNADGYGNACDTDYNDDGFVAIPDFITLQGSWGSTTGEPAYDPDVDSDGGGSIGTPEFILFQGTFGGPPGPSGLACAGTTPCP